MSVLPPGKALAPRFTPGHRRLRNLEALGPYLPGSPQTLNLGTGRSLRLTHFCLPVPGARGMPAPPCPATPSPQPRRLAAHTHRGRHGKAQATRDHRWPRAMGAEEPSHGVGDGRCVCMCLGRAGLCFCRNHRTRAQTRGRGGAVEMSPKSQNTMRFKKTQESLELESPGDKGA